MARYEKSTKLAICQGEEDGGLAKLAGALHTRKQTKDHMVTFTKGLPIKYGKHINETIIRQEQDAHARGLYEHVKERPDVEKALETYFL